MPDQRVVCNTSPLLYLHQIGQLHLLEDLYRRVWTTPGVVGELAIGAEKDHDVPLVDELPWLTIERPTRDTSQLPALLDLGRGEAEVIALATDSTQLFDRFQSGSDMLVLSELTLAELEGAPTEVFEVLRAIPAENVEEVGFSPEARELAEEYIAAEVIGAAHLEDAQHSALATVNRVDALVSWNFKHIVNLDRVRGYNSVNFRLGHVLLEIRTPQEVLRYERED